MSNAQKIREILQNRQNANQPQKNNFDTDQTNKNNSIDDNITEDISNKPTQNPSSANNDSISSSVRVENVTKIDEKLEVVKIESDRNTAEVDKNKNIDKKSISSDTQQSDKNDSTNTDENKHKSHIATDLSMEDDIDPRASQKDRKPLIPKMKAPDKTALDIKKEIVPEQKRAKLSGVSMDNIIVSIKSLSAMLKASMPLAESVKILAEQSSDAKLRSIFYTVIEDIHNGSNLYESLSTFPKVFNPMVISVIETGEKGGILEKNLVFLADFLKKEHELSKKIKGALMYPMIILGLAVVEFIGMIFFILPKLEALFTSFPNVPAFTVMLIGAAGFIRQNWIYILAGIVVVIFGLIQAFKTKKGKRLLDWVAIKFPVIKKLTVANVLATFSRTVGLLLGSGIHISKALKIATNTVHNSIYSDIIMEIYNDAKEGQSISATLKQYYNFFPISFIKLIEVGEVSGTLEDNLLYLNEHYSQQVDEISDNFATFIEPILLILIGVVIGLLTITMITPLYQFVSSINA